MSAEPAPRLRIARPTDATADVWSSLTDAERQMITERRAIVDAWREMCRQFAAADRTKGEATAAFLAGRPGLSRSTLYKWAARRDSPDPRDLLDGRRENGRHRAEARPSPEAWQRFKDLYLTPQQRTVALCWQIVAAEAEQHGWTWPSLRSIQRRVRRELPPFIADVHRLGDREWDKKYGDRRRRDYTKLRAGQLWHGDFHPFDVFCRVSESDPRIVRPLLCSFEDVTRTRFCWRFDAASKSTARHMKSLSTMASPTGRSASPAGARRPSASTTRTTCGLSSVA